MIARAPSKVSLRLFTSISRPNHFYLLDYKTHREWVITTKYRLDLSRVEQLCRTIAASLPGEIYEHNPLESDWTITWVPLNWLTRLKRRFDLNQIIAKRLGKQSGWQTLSLLKNCKRKTQGECRSKSERQNNAQNKFKSTKAIVPDNIIIFDDVVATGATMQACENLLRKAGARNIIWLSIAH